MVDELLDAAAALYRSSCSLLIGEVMPTSWQKVLVFVRTASVHTINMMIQFQPDNFER
jgi:hypothetical protein